MFCNSSSKYNILLTIQTSKETKNPQTRVSTNLSWCPVCHLSGSGDNRDTPRAHFADTRGKKSVKKRNKNTNSKKKIFKKREYIIVTLDLCNDN